MIKAEERAMEAIPPRYRKSKDRRTTIDSAKPVRTLYIKAYEQAKEDILAIVNSYGAHDVAELIRREMGSRPFTLKTDTSYDTQRYTPSPSLGLEDVARVLFASHAKIIDKKRNAVFGWEQFKEVAGIFYGFGKKHAITL